LPAISLRLLRTVGIALIGAALVFLLWRALLLGVGLLVLSILASVGWQQFAIWSAAQRFRREYRSLGKDLLLVYSNSPHWQSYVEANFIPKWKSRAVILNWSERATWKRSQPEVALFHALATQRAYNPLAIMVPPGGRPIVVRFWKAFRDHKHGRDRALKEQEAELDRVLALHSPPNS
jgi:hypothetical protein